MIRILTYFLLLVLLLNISIFATQNQQVYSLKFLNQTSIDLPLGLILVFSAGLGAIATTIWQVRMKPDQKISRSEVATGSSYSGSSSFPNSARKVKKEIRDFDDDFDDDWD
jgi:uncharacterized integral membrane protein